MRSALASVEGVDEDDVVIDFENKTATVVLDDPDPPTAEELKAVFEGSRFSATVKE